MQIHFKVNGSDVAVDAPPMARLLDVLRIDLGLTGSKEGCGEGECGACTVLVDGVAVNSCLVPVVQVRGRAVRTVEGIAQTGLPGDAPLERLSAVQAAFLAHGAAQCGICTPGFVVMATALLERNPRPTPEQVREGLSGNLCRCTGYQKIVDAVVTAIAAPVDRNTLAVAGRGGPAVSVEGGEGQ